MFYRSVFLQSRDDRRSTERELEEKVFFFLKLHFGRGGEFLHLSFSLFLSLSLLEQRRHYHIG